MIFSKKGRNKQGQKKHDEKSLYPILHVAGSLKEYQKDLSRKEVESLFEMSMVKSSFSGVSVYPGLTVAGVLGSDNAK